LVAFAAPAAPARAQTAADPALDVPQATLAAALHCPATFSHPAREPVLLVHGTFATDQENWGFNYALVLPKLGYDVCTVTLPNRSLGDIQVSSEYVVYAIEHMAAASGRKVDVMGHSQGAMQERWAVKWWPTVRAEVDDLVTLAGPNQGTALADRCSSLCFPSAWQMGRKSRFIAALNAGDQTPGDVSYTAVYSLTDELVVPAAPDPVGAIAGASNVLIQDVCPGRVVEHGQFAWDAAVNAVVMDAFTHPGPADPARVDKAVCLQYAFAGVNPTPDLLLPMREMGTFPDYQGVPAEPPVRSYAAASAQPAPSASPQPSSSGAAAAGAGRELPATGGLPLAGLGLVALAGGLATRAHRRR